MGLNLSETFKNANVAYAKVKGMGKPSNWTKNNVVKEWDETTAFIGRQVGTLNRNIPGITYLGFLGVMASTQAPISATIGLISGATIGGVIDVAAMKVRAKNIDLRKARNALHKK